MKFNLEIPINSVSLGQIGYGICYELFKRKIKPNIFPIGDVDLSAFLPDSNFDFWLRSCVQNAQDDFTKYPTIKHWHLNGSERVVGRGKQILWTPHELSEITPTEAAVCSNFDQVLVTSHYSKDVFKKGGVDTDVCPNFFDSRHFYEVSVPQAGKYNWGIFGKLEKRKHTRNAIVAWANKYGGDQDHRLLCQVFNPFLDKAAQGHEINSWFGGNCPWNITFYPFQQRNSDLNTLFNSVDIVIGLSGAEGWNLPLHTCLGLGKHAVVLDATGHKEFANSENSTLLEPSGMEDSSDGIFFHKGAKFNQGQIYNFTQNRAWEGFEKALDKLKTCGKVNVAGRATQSFTVSKTVDKLLTYVDN